MKTFKLIGVALITILMCLTACSDGKDEPDDPTPQKPVESTITIDASIITNGIAFTTVGGEKSISFNANTDWTLNIASTTGGSTWCTASATRGSKGETTVKFTATENTEYEDRSVAVTIKAGTASKTFTITQKCKDAMLLTSNKFEVSQKGGSIEVEVKANIDYQMEVSETAKSWITKANTRALTARKHTFNIAANEEYEKREGEIYFISGEQKEVVKVYQTGGAVIMLTKNDYTVSDKGETITVEIKSNFEYGVRMPDVDWISDASTRGASSHTLKYVVSPNETYDSRSAQIIYYDKSNTSIADTLTITQAQKDAIIISQKEQNVESKGGIIEVKLNTNVDFDIEMPQADWIKRVPDTRGLTEHTVKFTVSENTGNDSRSADIVFTDKNKQIKETVTVTQQALIKTVTLKAAGTLEKLLGDQYLKIEALKVIGPLNGDDIDIIRHMEGRRNSYSSNSFDGKLSYLDLSDASIVEGEIYHNWEHMTYFYTSNDEIGDSMFCHCKGLRTIMLPNSITTIGRNAFYCCTGLTSITIPNSVTTIGRRAFKGCTGLTSITIPNSVTTIGDYAFEDCTGLTSVTIGSGVTDIGWGAFRDCTGLTSVTIGNGVTDIGVSAFSGCTGLTSITIPNSVTTVGERAFYGCTGLTSITIGSGVTTIENDAFYNCYIKKCHIYATTPPEKAYQVFSTVAESTLYVPKGCAEKYKEAGWGSFFDNIVEMEE